MSGLKLDLDLLVIGAGLSGLMAAAKAVEQGNRVMVAAKGIGTLGLSSGCIDFWGFEYESPQKLCLNPLVEITKLVAADSRHPFTKVRDVIRESIDFFEDICLREGNPYGTNSGGNWLLPTALGTLRPTYLAPTSMAVPVLTDADKILVVGFEELKDFYPQVTVNGLRLNEKVAETIELATVMIKISEGDLNSNALAHLLEKQQSRDKVIKQIRPLVSPDTIALFPPVLGERRNTAVAAELAEGIGCRVYEVANIPPALPGQRLQKTLLHHLKNQGVEAVFGAEVIGADVDARVCKSVTVCGAGSAREISAQAYVLATGSFLGGGLEAKQTELRETVFGLPVVGARGEWSSEEFLDKNGHPFSRFGIAVNDLLQPINTDQQVLVKNLLVCGADLAGCNYPIEKCGNGVALSTGYKAGKLAKEVGL